MGSNVKKSNDDKPTAANRMIELAQNTKQNTKKDSAFPLGTTKTAVTILQFLVGGLVTMGGSLFALFAVNTFGRSLGMAHLSIGLLGLAGGFSALRERPWSKTYLLAINGLTIAYSSLSESIVQIQSLLPSPSSLGSLVGTIIAIIMIATIIYLLMTKKQPTQRM